MKRSRALSSPYRYYCHTIKGSKDPSDPIFQLVSPSPSLFFPRINSKEPLPGSNKRETSTRAGTARGSATDCILISLLFFLHDSQPSCRKSTWRRRQAIVCIIFRCVKGCHLEHAVVDDEFVYLIHEFPFQNNFPSSARTATLVYSSPELSIGRACCSIIEADNLLESLKLFNYYFAI